MTNRLEVWFAPTGGIDAEATLLEARHLAPGETPPVYCNFSDPMLVAANSTCTQHEDGWLHKVEMIYTDYGDSGDTSRSRRTA